MRGCQARSLPNWATKPLWLPIHTLAYRSVRVQCVCVCMWLCVCMGACGSQVQQGHTWLAFPGIVAKLKPHRSPLRNFGLPLYALLIFYGPNENFHSRFMRQPTKCSSAQHQAGRFRPGKRNCAIPKLMRIRHCSRLD